MKVKAETAENLIEKVWDGGWKSGSRPYWPRSGRDLVLFRQDGVGEKWGEVVAFVSSDSM